VARRRKSSIVKSIIIIIFVWLALSAVIYYAIKFFTASPHINYPAFGIYIPPGYKIHGIDVSRYQHTINWNDVKQMQVKDIKIGFVFIKATEGVGKVDAYFRRNWLEAEEAEISKGAYHYFISGKVVRCKHKILLI
jgi:lysozyme